MPWFRLLRRKHEQDAAPAAAIEVPAPPEQPPVTEPEAPDGATGPAKKRRRGSRGGKNRRKTGEAAAASEGAGEVPVTPTATERPAKTNGTRRRGSQQQQQRRRQPPRRAPLPAAKRELVISVDVGEQRVAILEDDRVAEVYLERPERRSIAGNIYLGTVDNVLPGMEAAFVEIGLEKNGFLYVDEIVVPELEGKRHGKKITDLISRGQQILVQAVKDPMKTKGARLTTEISLPGRFLVYVPNGEGLGVSRRLEDAERQRLKDILKSIAPSEGGVIVRTAAEGASAEDVERDLVFLQRLWKTIQTRAASATAPDLVYQEAELPLRIVRDLFAGDFVGAYVDNDRAYKRIVGYLKKTSPHMLERVHRYKEKEPLFERYGVEQEISSTLDRRVDLPSGGYLIFDYAEAFTVVDVNTGRFVGSRSKSSGQRLEDTIVKNNLEAVKEVVRQLRLRDIGGIIVIDFIDMANSKNRQAVEEALRNELERDRTKTYVVEISPLGLVEMTRQNVTDGPREVMTRKCPTCDGDGIVVSDATAALVVERGLRTLAVTGAGSRVQAYRVAVHPRTLVLLAGPGGERLAALEEATRRRFFLVPAEGHAHSDHLEVLAEGRLADLQPATSLEEGAELEVKPVEVGLHDPTAGVAKLDGVDLVVADAAKLVGKRTTVRVGRVLDGIAFATVAGGAPGANPITFESEAEKPTRAPARRKVEQTAAPADGETADADEATVAVVAIDEEEAEEVIEPLEPLEQPEDGAAGVDAEASSDTAETPKKKTRRGSRGGRKRKKKPAVTVEAEGGAEIAVSEPAEDEPTEPLAEQAAETKPKPKPARPRPRRTPKIHVPTAAGAADEPGEAEPEAREAEPEAIAADGETTGDGAPTQPRKRTRRGSRGGRNRKKRTGTATNGDAAGAVEESVEDERHGDGPGDGHAVPEASPRPEPEPEQVAEPAVDLAAVEPEGYVPMSEWIEDFERRN